MRENLTTIATRISQIFSLVWQASQPGTLALGAIAFTAGLVPPGIAWMKKLMIDQVISLVEQGADPWAGALSMVPMLLGILGLLLTNEGLLQARQLAEKNLRGRLRLHINTLIINKSLALNLSYFEDADYYDKLQNARNEADQRALGIVIQVFKTVQFSVTFISFAALLVRFHPLLVLILLGATLPSFGMQNHYGRLTFRLLSGQAPERREMRYYEELLTIDKYAKEVKLFGIGRTLIKRYTAQFWEVFNEDMQLAKKRSVVSLLWGMAGLSGYFVAIGWIMVRTIAQSITFGDAVLYMEVFERSHYLGQNMLNTLTRLYENSLFVSNVFVFLSLEPEQTGEHDTQPAPARITQGIELRDVCFKYPGQSEFTLQHVNLTLHPGENLALVGLNGAGKTTLVKLLTGLYTPTSGEILVDGVNIHRMAPAAWREKIGVIFQDYVQYQFTAAENVGVGRIAAIDDHAQITEAAQKGGAHTLICALPQGYTTRLGRWFADGHELSIGQWQKVALSRAFMRQAEVLILDEPTASLDPEQEAQIFQRFHTLTQGKIAVLISHRFSTVRMADRIAVLERGTITEVGTHKDLIAHGGTYARLFNTQAAGYR